MEPIRRAHGHESPGQLVLEPEEGVRQHLGRIVGPGDGQPEHHGQHSNHHRITCETAGQYLIQAPVPFIVFTLIKMYGIPAYFFCRSHQRSHHPVPHDFPGDTVFGQVFPGFIQGLCQFRYVKYIFSQIGLQFLHKGRVAVKKLKCQPPGIDFSLHPGFYQGFCHGNGLLNDGGILNLVGMKVLLIIHQCVQLLKELLQAFLFPGNGAHNRYPQLFREHFQVNGNVFARSFIQKVDAYQHMV